MKLSTELLERLKGAMALATGEMSPGWLLTAAMAFEAAAADIREEVENAHIREVASTPAPETPPDAA